MIKKARFIHYAKFRNISNLDENVKQLLLCFAKDMYEQLKSILIQKKNIDFLIKNMPHNDLIQFAKEYNKQSEDFFTVNPLLLSEEHNRK